MLDLLKLIFGGCHWLPSALQWYAAISTAARLSLKPFSLRLQSRLTELMLQAQDDDARDWETILRSRWYRWTAFTLDLVLSFKLPTIAVFTARKPIAST